MGRAVTALLTNIYGMNLHHAAIIHKFWYSKGMKRGFTLVELLVVIAIIAVLSMVGMSVYSGANTNARDARRKMDLHAMQNSLEAYKSITGSYPTQTGGLSAGSLWGSSWAQCSPSPCGILATALVPTYIQALPIDPVNTAGSDWLRNGGRFYSYFSSDSTSYVLGTNLESLPFSQEFYGNYQLKNLQ